MTLKRERRQDGLVRAFSDMTSNTYSVYLLLMCSAFATYRLGLIYGRRTTHAHYTHRYPFITLHYGRQRDERVIEHNCLMARHYGQSLTVHTTMPWLGYCRACRCVLMKLSDCTERVRNAKGSRRNKNNCDKLWFVARTVPRLGAFFFLDSDLLVVRGSFFHMLQMRAQAHDFLAAYGHHTRRMAPRYNNPFNSGLFFIRALKDVNYSELMTTMEARNTTRDQGVLSDFVRKHYRNWDTLSVKFNCRGLLRFKDDVPPEHCLAIHDRAESPELHRILNITMLTVGR